MLLQSGLRMIALINPVTYVWPALIRPGGCSDTVPFGVIHDTAGRSPSLAAVKKLGNGSMSPSWSSCWTSVKYGSGFQMPGVLAVWTTGAHDIAALSSQSGWLPAST